MKSSFCPTTQERKFLSAYSLVEILVVLAIMGILFTTGYANYRSFTSRQIIANSSKEIQANLRLAQEMALSGQKPSDAQCTGSNTLRGYSFRVLSTTTYEIRASCSGGFSSSATKTVSLPNGITISTNPNPNPIIFNVLGNGTNISASTTIAVRNASGATASVTITSGGQIQ